MNGEVFLDGQSLLTGGIYVNPNAKLEEKTITENGVYYPSTGMNGFSKVTVNVPQPQPVLDSITITENGNYTPPEGTDGYNDINVNVPAPTILLQDKTITANGIYTADQGYDGLGEVNVNIETYEGVVSPPLYVVASSQNMTVIKTLNNIDIQWVSGSNIGMSLNGDVNLSGNNFTKLKFDITTGTCYDHDKGQNIRPLIIGVSGVIRTGPIYVSPTDAPTYFKAYKLYDVNDINKHIVDFVDLSNVTGDYYIFIVATGWNVKIDSLKLE